MKIFKRILLVMGVLVVAFGLFMYFYLKKAHSSFYDYYAYRGCEQLVKKAEDYGICKIKSGQAIKIVKFKDKWYLDGDLPSGFLFF